MDTGSKSTVTFEVDKNMTADFEGKRIHDVLSTFHLVYYAELAVRKMIEPFLEDGEEAVGFEINLKHLRPAKIGDRAEVTATLIKKDGKKLVCEIEAVNSKEKI